MGHTGFADPRIDITLSACLSGLPVAWPAPPDQRFEASFVERAEFHRVHVLLHEFIGRRTETPAWPPSVRDRIARLAHAETASEMLRSHELARVLGALAEKGVHSLLIKGAALAHTAYASPCHRPRVDSDLLVAPADQETAEGALASLGYARATRISGTLIEYQSAYFRDEPHGIRHIVDLHWRAFNRQSLAYRFPFEELASRARPVPALGASARALDPVDALLVACIHGSAHHSGQETPLIWVYDVHRLATPLADPAWAELVERAARRRVRRLCAHGLIGSRQWFRTRMPEGVLEELWTAGACSEPSARLLSPRRRDPFWNDLASLPGWSRRLRFLWEAAFPSAAYLQRRYGIRSRLLLPLLYLRRTATGLWRRAW